MSVPGDVEPTAAQEPPAAAAPRGRGLRAAGVLHARRVAGAYAGEHGVYGIVLVTALVAAEIEAETDWDVIVFVLGTVGVFWLAHIYAAVVSARGRRPVPRLRTAIWHGVGHSSGMVIAMLIPVALLATGTLGLLDEWVAYYLALGSGIAILAAIGYANARRNASTWPWRLAGVATTTSLGAVVIALSIWAHM